MEEMFKFVIRWIRTWSSLLLIALGMYIVAGIPFGFLVYRTPSLSSVSLELFLNSKLSGPNAVWSSNIGLRRRFYAILSQQLLRHDRR